MHPNGDLHQKQRLHELCSNWLLAAQAANRQRSRIQTASWSEYAKWQTVPRGGAALQTTTLPKIHCLPLYCHTHECNLHIC
jgi:hypothetical protein